MDKLEGLHRHLSRKGIRQGTVHKVITSLTHILSKTKTLDAAACEDFLFSLLEQGRSPGYLNTLVQSLRHYGTFAEDESYKKIKYFLVHEAEKGVLSDREITAFLKVTPEIYNDYLRNTLKRGGGHVNIETWNAFTLFFRVLAFSGLRPNELCQMRLGQCDLGSKVFRLDSTTKTRKPRTVSINDAIVPDLENHLKQLPTDRLFPNWSRHKWKEQFNMRIKYLGIKRDKITTYSLRHSWVTRLLDEGANPHVMAEMAGHSLEQQRHYYRLTTKSKRTAINKDTLGRKSLTKTERLLQGRKVLEDLGFIVPVAKEIAGGFMFEVLEE